MRGAGEDRLQVRELPAGPEGTAGSDITRDAGVRHAAQDDPFHAGSEQLEESGRRGLAPGDLGRRPHRRRTSHVEHGVVPESGELVVGAAALHQRLGPRAARLARRQGGEELRADEQLLFVGKNPLGAGERLGGGALRSIAQSHRRRESTVQPGVAHVADERRSARREDPHRPLEDAPEVFGAREVLHDRVQDDRVEGTGLQAAEVLRTALQQLDVGKLLPARRGAPDEIQGDAGEVRRHVALA